jgi:hypothetical protein
MQEQLKLIVAGSVGAGKTTFIRSISEIDTVDTDVEASEDLGKEFTTVAMDYGLLHLDGIPLHIYGTPGQDRFDFMWEVLCQGALGLVLLVRGDKISDFAKARNILDFITSRINVPFLIGVTRHDLPDCWHTGAIADFFALDEWQVVGLNATEQNDCLGVIACLLEMVVSVSEFEEEQEIDFDLLFRPEQSLDYEQKPSFDYEQSFQ